MDLHDLKGRKPRRSELPAFHRDLDLPRGVSPTTVTSHEARYHHWGLVFARHPHIESCWVRRHGSLDVMPVGNDFGFAQYCLGERQWRACL